MLILLYRKRVRGGGRERENGVGNGDERAGYGKGQSVQRQNIYE